MVVPLQDITVCFARRRIAPNHRRVKCYGNGQPPPSLFIRAGHAARCLVAANAVIKHHAFGCGSIDARLHGRPLMGGFAMDI